jgi:hypothetical protein
MGLDLGTSLIGAGTGLQAYGAYQQGQDTSASKNIEANQLTQRAGQVRQITDYKARLIHQVGRTHLSDIEAETGKAGLAMSGTPLNVLVDEARKVELEAQMAQWQGNVEAQGLGYASDVAKWEGGQARTAGDIGAASSILNGLGRLAYYQAMRNE